MSDIRLSCWVVDPSRSPVIMAGGKSAALVPALSRYSQVHDGSLPLRSFQLTHKQTTHISANTAIDMTVDPMHARPKHSADRDATMMALGITRWCW